MHWPCEPIACGETIPTSSAVAPWPKAKVRTSAGRSAVPGIRPSDSSSADGSQVFTWSNKKRETQWWPRVASAREHQLACEPLPIENATPQRPQSIRSAGRAHPNRARTASTYSSASSTGDRFRFKAHNQSWSVSGCDRWLMRSRASCCCASRCCSRSAFFLCVST